MGPSRFRVTQCQLLTMGYPRVLLEEDLDRAEADVVSHCLDLVEETPTKRQFLTMDPSMGPSRCRVVDETPNLCQFLPMGRRPRVLLEGELDRAEVIDSQMEEVRCQIEA
jgi:hypothetical protein